MAAKKPKPKKAKARTGAAIPGHSATYEAINAEVVSSSEMDAINWDNDEAKGLPEADQVITPFGWKVLVMPMRRGPVSKGGILLPQVRQDADEYINYVGRVVALGPLCYRHSKYAEMGMEAKDQPKRGDWVIYPIYQYARIDFKGTKLILLNDDSFLAMVPKGVSPWDFRLER